MHWKPDSPEIQRNDKSSEISLYSNSHFCTNFVCTSSIKALIDSLLYEEESSDRNSLIFAQSTEFS